MPNRMATKERGKEPQNSGKSDRCRDLRLPNIQTMGWMTALLSLLVILSLGSSALAQQDPCFGHGPGCRVMTTDEVKALKERFLALKAALPVPDPGRWALASGVGEEFTMPFVAELNLGTILTCDSWPSGCFIEKNDISFPYDPRAERKKPETKPKDSKDPKDIDKALKEALAWVEQMQADVGNRIEVGAKLLPHPYLADNVMDNPNYVIIEKRATFLSWQSDDGTNLTMVFGPYTSKEAETLKVNKPAKALAPVKAIELTISGPNKAEVAALKQKVNRQAFEALLGPVLK